MRAPSSDMELSSAGEFPLTLVLEELQKLPRGIHVELGPSLPSSYGQDRFLLMVQDPFHVFAYWEVTELLKSQALSEYPAEDRVDFQLLLEWNELSDGGRVSLDAGTSAAWWFVTKPGKQYQARLCLYSESYGAVALMSSNAVETPACVIGPVESPAEGESTTTEWLNRLLEQACIVGLATAVEPKGQAIAGEISQPADRETLDKPTPAGQVQEADRPAKPVDSQRKLPFARPTSW